VILADPPVNPFDWTPVWSLSQSLLVGFVAVIGTLVGVIATDRRAARREREARVDARRMELRAVALDLVETGPAFAMSLVLYASGEAALPDGSELPPDEVKRGRDRFEAASLAHERAISRFLLTVRDEEPVQLVLDLRAKLREMATVTGPWLVSGFTGKPPTREQAKDLLSYATDYGKQARALQDDLAPYLAERLTVEADKRKHARS